MATIVEILKQQLLETLKSRTEYVDGCWCYISSTNSTTGYADIAINKRLHGVHRISASLFLGMDLDNPILFALHKNECLHKNCWNPDHLYAGTHAQNMADIRLKPCRTCGGPRHGKYTQTRDGVTKFYCIPCRNNTQKRRRRAK